MYHFKFTDNELALIIDCVTEREMSVRELGSDEEELDKLERLLEKLDGAKNE